VRGCNTASTVPHRLIEWDRRYARGLGQSARVGKNELQTAAPKRAGLDLVPTQAPSSPLTFEMQPALSFKTEETGVLFAHSGL
jgi:hypothetical protein